MNPVLSAPRKNGQAPPDLYGPIARDLEQVEDVLAQTLKSRYAPVAAVVNHVGHYRGKRLRPALLLLVGRACGRLTREHQVLGAVVEMIHTATLVHDDVLDSATVRRHVPTVNAKWDNQTSVLLGDYLFTHAFHLSATLGDARACKIIGEATNRVCEGELCQGLEQGNLALAEESYFDMIDGKTAELISCCCRLGALFSRVDDQTVENMARYGRQLGLAFQITDDLLDLEGDEHATGKSLGTDLEQLKLTLPLIHYLGRTMEVANLRARQLLASPGNRKREKLMPLLVESGSLDYARRRAQHCASQALSELGCLPPSPCRSLLELLARRVVDRNS
ncbi:MAG: polyprenyl synthetase family protein [Gemmataceae bacterium]